MRVNIATYDVSLALNPKTRQATYRPMLTKSRSPALALRLEATFFVVERRTAIPEGYERWTLLFPEPGNRLEIRIDSWRTR